MSKKTKPANKKPTIQLSPAPKKLLSLDLGCGQSPREGFEGVDLVPGPTVKHVVNLFKFPWPWADNSVEKIFTSHLLEHIPMAYVSPKGEYKLVPDSKDDQDLFFRFFDECWRILTHNGRMLVVVPAVGSDRAFQDPTHRRFFPSETFLYLSRKWREAQKLDHYNVKCSFSSTCDAHFTEPAARVEEVQSRMVRQYRNFVTDWIANLTAVKE